MNLVKNQIFLFIGLILSGFLCAKTEQDGSGSEYESEFEIDEADINEKPLIITRESFSKVINQPETGTFVMFHAPWW
jgi:hypothetical protein